MHFQNTQIWRGQDQRRSNLWAATAWAAQAMAVTAFSPAPWIPPPHYLLPAPQGWEGSVQGSRTFSLLLPAPPRPFWEAWGQDCPPPDSLERVSFGLLRKDSVPSHSQARSRMMTRRAELPPSSARASQWGRVGKGRVGRQPGVWRPHLFTLLRICIQFLCHRRPPHGRIYEPVHAFLMKFWGQHIWLVTHFCRSPDKTTL